jgi:isopropylmalate/homocitrate/citramalate synthase
MVSDQGGKSNFINALKRRGIQVGKDDPKLDTLIAIVKEREATGYAYEGADASFELLAHRATLGGCRNSSTSTSSADGRAPLQRDGPDPSRCPKPWSR